MDLEDKEAGARDMEEATAVVTVKVATAAAMMATEATITTEVVMVVTADTITADTVVTFRHFSSVYFV